MVLFSVSNYAPAVRVCHLTSFSGSGHASITAYSRSRRLLYAPFRKKFDLDKYVRELRWTVLDLSHPEDEQWEDEKMLQRFNEQRDAHDNELALSGADTEDMCFYYDDTEAHELRACALWQTFRSLVNVSTIDICWLSQVRSFARHMIFADCLVIAATSSYQTFCSHRPNLYS